jgi:hypothetical protein
MTLEGWQDYADRETVETVFYSAFYKRVKAHRTVTSKEQFSFALELSRAAGGIRYCLHRMSEDKNHSIWENYLIELLKRMSWELAKVR